MGTASQINYLHPAPVTRQISKLLIYSFLYTAWQDRMLKRPTVRKTVESEQNVSTS
jgi:hypothetical protein